MSSAWTAGVRHVWLVACNRQSSPSRSAELSATLAELFDRLLAMIRVCSLRWGS